MSSVICHYIVVLNIMLRTTVLELLAVIKDDDDRQVVMVAYDVMTEMLKDIRSDMLIENPESEDITELFNQMVYSVVSAFNHKVRHYLIVIERTNHIQPKRWWYN